MPRDFVRLNPPPGTAPTHAPTDVKALLALNLHKQTGCGHYDVDEARRKYVPRTEKWRKRRDYVATLLVGNGICYTVHALVSGTNIPKFDLITWITAGAMVMFTGAATWIFWFVMD